MLEALEEKVLAGGAVTKEEALWLYEKAEEGALAASAERIRAHFCGNGFDLCTIINGKSGRCSENCAFCAQSSHYHTGAETYPLMDTASILKEAKYNEARGVRRFAIVTSGRALSDEDVKELCDTVRVLKAETTLSICVSGGLLGEEAFRALKAAGVTRIHNNLEASEGYFKNVCTTHTFQDKVRTIRDAQKVGLEVCSGGIFGLGEGIEDRIDMAFSLRDLGVDSVPLNMLNPIPGTPFEGVQVLDAATMKRLVAVYRFILPKTPIRLAGGRGLLVDNGRGCFESGANALITGDMLTTTGTTIETDRKTIDDLGFEVTLL